MHGHALTGSGVAREGQGGGACACLKRADFDKMKCLLINGVDQFCFEHDDIDCIWNSVEDVIKHSLISQFQRKVFISLNHWHG